MGCFTEAYEPVIDVKFKVKKNTQKHFIEYLLNYSECDFNALAKILEISPLKFNLVLSGKGYLDKDTVIKLFKYFIMMVEN
ncbi:hypothetical protein E3983_11060 [Legionella israelensis]|uniref:XRE family transcriptional regulator n=1 Tax=Legionella israelensis TaxID=454 RepID=A0A0W0WDV1_9GAMM|nr:hypothetical protein [Legionella israelensis]KTD30538.1 hypothetical protein Lisr_0720 [Legionella israelensis]QBR84842.1 hypothetical protein E3983_11060 [Legionella israelensis]QBS10282.1 hypothetical protein E4T55_10675 [Legionella israelensis]QDP73321.1 hypothetical protein FOG18_12485 [Legionella israelensis]SCY39318.1 hypothetical protein SAMN02746069_02286 [Legionella israelensis DSM 19235]